MFGNSFGPTAFDLKFRLFGVAVSVHPTFWLGGLWFAQYSHGLLMVASIATLFVSILTHEMGHALSGKYFGDRNPSVTLHMMGGYYMPGNALRHKQFIWMVLWGPMAGFFLGGLAVGAWFGMVFGLIPITPMLTTVAWDAMWINIIWGVVNLMPVFPLDGGALFREVIRWKVPSRDDVFSYTVSMVSAVVLALLMAAGSFYFGYTPSIFLGALAFQNYQLRAQAILIRKYGSGEADEPRQPWQQDPDWWKKN